jgi:hypothetical protein
LFLISGLVLRNLNRSTLGLGVHINGLRIFLGFHIIRLFHIIGLFLDFNWNLSWLVQWVLTSWLDNLELFRLITLFDWICLGLLNYRLRYDLFLVLSRFDNFLFGGFGLHSLRLTLLLFVLRVSFIILGLGICFSLIYTCFDIEVFCQLKGRFGCHLH